MNKKMVRTVSVIAAAFILAAGSGTAAFADSAEEFTALSNYQDWAANIGYPQKMLEPMGVEGINQDYFHTLPDAPGYSSGRIIVGDSRCCQLGIFAQRKETADFAAFAVWGGHYQEPSMTDTLWNDLEACFRKQMQETGKCTVFLFATVNDYDYQQNDNAENIAAVISLGERIAALTDTADGVKRSPQVIVIGFDGGRTDAPIFGIPQEDFNRYIGNYNEMLAQAVRDSNVLKPNAESFTTVPAITGGSTGFIADGLHYSDSTLQTITDYIRDFSGEPARGKAVRYGKTIDAATLSDDEALRSAGFDDTDIACLKNGENVIYSVIFDMDDTKTYEDLAADSAEKQKIDAYYSGKAPTPDDSLMTTFRAVRERGTEQPEILENVTNVSGKVVLGLLEEQGDANDFVKNGKFTMLYLGGEQAVKAQATASAYDNKSVLVDFTFLGNGNYIVLYDENKPAQTTAVTTVSSGKTSSGKNSNASKTADAGSLPAVFTGISAALAAILAGNQRRRRK